jgi:hypothetical protein
MSGSRPIAQALSSGAAPVPYADELPARGGRADRASCGTGFERSPRDRGTIPAAGRAPHPGARFLTGRDPSAGTLARRGSDPRWTSQGRADDASWPPRLLASQRPQCQPTPTRSASDRSPVAQTKAVNWTFVVSNRLFQTHRLSEVNTLVRTRVKPARSLLEAPVANGCRAQARPGDDGFASLARRRRRADLQLPDRGRWTSPGCQCGSSTTAPTCTSRSSR